MKILVLDNYDSFTYNLVHLIRENGFAVDIFRNDKISLREVDRYDKILLSPGPGIPDEAGIMKEVVREYGSTKSILGICLGHQGIGEVYGASLVNIPIVLHGVTSSTKLIDSTDYLFKDVSSKDTKFISLFLFLRDLILWSFNFSISLCFSSCSSV